MKHGKYSFTLPGNIFDRANKRVGAKVCPLCTRSNILPSKEGGHLTVGDKTSPSRVNMNAIPGQSSYPSRQESLDGGLTRTPNKRGVLSDTREAIEHFARYAGLTLAFSSSPALANESSHASALPNLDQVTLIQPAQGDQDNARGKKEELFPTKQALPQYELTADMSDSPLVENTSKIDAELLALSPPKGTDVYKSLASDEYRKIIRGCYIGGKDAKLSPVDQKTGLIALLNLLDNYGKVEDVLKNGLVEGKSIPKRLTGFMETVLQIYPSANINRADIQEKDRQMKFLNNAYITSKQAESTNLRAETDALVTFRNALH